MTVRNQQRLENLNTTLRMYPMRRMKTIPMVSVIQTLRKKGKEVQPRIKKKAKKQKTHKEKEKMEMHTEITAEKKEEENEANNKHKKDEGPQKYAIGLFSKAPSVETPNTPTNCYWVNANSMQQYYFAFSDHPLVVPHVHVNDPAVNSTWIFSALRGITVSKLKIIANKIVQLRSEPFKNFKDMIERLEKAVSVDKTFVRGKINKADIKHLETSTLKFNFFSVELDNNVDKPSLKDSSSALSATSSKNTAPKTTRKRGRNSNDNEDTDEDEPQNKKQKITSAGPPFQCPHCPKIYEKSKPNFEAHVKSHKKE